jgi:hypothetical protein
MNVLMREKHGDFQLQISYIRETGREDMLRLGQQLCSIHYQWPIPKKTSSPYGNDSEEESDGPPPSPKKTDATEMKIDKSLQLFIEALPHLEPLHYGFKLQASNE